MEKDTDSQYLFNVVTEARTFFFYAATPQERDIWVGALSLARLELQQRYALSSVIADPRRFFLLLLQLSPLLPTPLSLPHPLPVLVSPYVFPWFFLFLLFYPLPLPSLFLLLSFGHARPLRRVLPSALFFSITLFLPRSLPVCLLVVALLFLPSLSLLFYPFLFLSLFLVLSLSLSNSLSRTLELSLELSIGHPMAV
jgi:hypothetical protein